MGNKQGQQGGYAAPGVGQPRTVRSEAERQFLANQHEQRLNKKRPVKKKKEDILSEHWERYASIDTMQTPGPAPVAAAPRVGGGGQATGTAPKHTPATAAGAGAGSQTTVKCPVCRRGFPTEAAFYHHFEQAHNGRDAERALRAQQAEARLKRKGPSNKKQNKEERWKRYASLGTQPAKHGPTSPAVPPPASPLTPSDDEKHADVGSIDEAVFQAEVEAAEAAFLSNPPEIRAASGKMLRSILNKLLTATPETRERFSKIKLSNPKVQEKIVRVPGALDILKVLGFGVVSLNKDPSDLLTSTTDDYLVFQSESLALVSVAVQRLGSLQ